VLISNWMCGGITCLSNTIAFEEYICICYRNGQFKEKKRKLNSMEWKCNSSNKVNQKEREWERVERKRRR
jgi:hypothetical protein